MNRISPLVALAAVLPAATPALAQIQSARPEAAGHWRALTELDLEAAYALVNDNHPAAAPELGDSEFRAKLAEAIAAARSRAAKVDSYGGYAAVLNGFAVALGDQHLWSRQAVRPAAYWWTGLSIARRGDGWAVADDARQGQAALVGARLVSCDGHPADAIAEDRLGAFRGVWTMEAQRVQTAPWLLVDDGNPFTPRPGTCVFDLDGKRSTVELAWTPISATRLAPHITKAVNVGAAGFGLRRFEGGYWIALESLDGRAREVVDAVKAQAAEMRAAPMVVLDLRGNGGGSSSFGDEIAAALLGQDYVRRASPGSGAGDCPDLWRATPGNRDGLGRFVREHGPRLDADSRAFWEGALRELTQAVDAGRPFSAPVSACAGVEEAEPTPDDIGTSAFKGRLVLLTDAECFSSCLLVTRQFRALGALHVGATTDGGNRYMEVREALLPSGLSYASTLQKVSPGSPRRIGPFAPSRVFQGSMADTAALESWIAEMR